MSKLGFTFYPKDWWTSETFFELEPIERYLYLEMMFLMYQNDGYFTLSKTQFERRLLTQIKPNNWEKITQLLTYSELGYTHESVKKRRSKADISRENGKKGGRPPKPRNPEINPPLEYKEKGIEIEEESKTESNFYTVDLFIKDWNELKTKHTKKKSGILVLDSGLKDQYYKLLKDGFNKEIITGGLIGLFKQKIFPNSQDFTTDPRHFLKDGGIFINKYYDAFLNQNKFVYGEDKKEY